MTEIKIGRRRTRRRRRLVEFILKNEYQGANGAYASALVSQSRGGTSRGGPCTLSFSVGHG